ncbi:hypothetical protein [Nocardioides sp. SYSU DS0663]|uniref:hypothetical protein n=1 Tax=Nocardioides sp. SYSU DS0663 TaxID=3416445 RepID=UPI003F4CAD90
MPILSDHPTTRRSQAAALVAAPVAGLVTTLTWPRTPLDPAERLVILADAAERTQVAHTLNLLTILLFIPAVAGMYRLLQPRRPRAAMIGSSLVAAGLVGWSGVLALSSAELQIARNLDGDAGLAAAESLPSSPVAVAMTAMFLLCTFGGLVVLTIALWRSGVTRGWVPAAVALAVVGDMAASTLTVVVVAVWVLMTASFAAIARARVAAPVTNPEAVAAPA